MRSTDAAKSLPGHSLDLDGGGLADLQPAAIGFVEPRLEMNRRQVGQLDDVGAGPRAIAFAELDLAAEHAARAVVRHDVHDAGGRRLDLQRVQTALRSLEVELRLVALALFGDDVGLRGGLVGRGLGFGLAQLLLASATASFACSYSSFDTRSRLPRSSFARSRSYRAFITAVWSCSCVIRCCACTCAISASDCFNSESFSCIRCFNVVASNSTSMSPAFTASPFFASLTICSSPACSRRRRARSTSPAGCRRGAGGSRRNLLCVTSTMGTFGARVRARRHHETAGDRDDGDCRHDRHAPVAKRRKVITCLPDIPAR